ncbi:MAG: oxidoreductase [Promethearchaeota archaeon]
MRYIKLFEPLKLRTFTIRNRIVIPAMHLNYSLNGEMNDQLINFYTERAKGGVGMIIIGGCSVEKRAGAPAMISIEDDKFIPGLKRLADSVHEHDTKIAAQLYHAGRYAFPFLSGEENVSASSIYSRFSKSTSRTLEIDEIHEVQDTIAKAAFRAKKANYDAVELLGSAGYLMDQFLSPVTNKRTDEYGGPWENRIRFPLELVRKVRKQVGKNFTVGIRVGGDDFIPGSNTYIEKAEIAKLYAQEGVDWINVTGGWHETRTPQLTMGVPPGVFTYLAQNIKNQVDVPVFASNRINTPKLAESVLRDGMADAVCMGRAFIADPYFVKKVKEGRERDILACVACNACFDGVFQMEPIQCMRNFETSREGKYDLSKKTEIPKKVLIVGAGVSGLEAARIATILGHEVLVIERRDDIGGQLMASTIPGILGYRDELKRMYDYYKEQIRRVPLQVKFGLEVTPEIVRDYGADAVICATGVKFSIPPIPGIDGSLGSDVCFADEALVGDHPVGKNVVVVGGAATGVETAIWAARLGAMTPDIAHFLYTYKALPTEEILKKWVKGPRNVTMLELLPRIGNSIGKSTRWTMLDEIKHLGIEVVTNATITKFEGKTVHFTHNNEEKTLGDVDTFILATGVKPNRDLYNKLKKMELPSKLYRIGDCKKPRTLLEAIHEGYKVAYNLDKK